ncbi:hypothetical protein [[Clostridium] aminophilum]|uniref:Uncharacterized protein n=1 Tax=[Clostridium] aminophilum TaxID=1526 RepID=A0A1I6IV15_9FIRM|nr:hypothetical protein [[Clostridium] aminophilum]SFR70050.1 hypothetical protein SAMN02910262_00808 [[Clostridium] aminophilum]
MFEIIFCIPWIIVASVWGFILLNTAGRNRAILNDDKLCRNPELVRQARDTLRTCRIMEPIVIMILAVMTFVLIQAFHPIAKIPMEGVALAAGDFIFSYIGAAAGACSFRHCRGSQAKGDAADGQNSDVFLYDRRHHRYDRRDSDLLIRRQAAFSNGLPLPDQFQTFY